MKVCKLSTKIIGGVLVFLPSHTPEEKTINEIDIDGSFSKGLRELSLQRYLIRRGGRTTHKMVNNLPRFK